MSNTELVPVANTAEIARVEIDTQIATAQQFKRNPKASLEEAISMATMNSEIAESCKFKKPVKTHMENGTRVVDEWAEGPSIRLAEICMSAWGNIRTATRIVSIDEKRVVVEAVAHDVQKNIYYQSSISRSIWGKYGRYPEHLVEQTVNAAQSIALRNAVLRVVPRGFVESVMSAAEKKAVTPKSAVKSKVDQALDYAAAKYGVSAERVLASVGRTDKTQVTAEDLDHLRGVFTAIKENEIDVEAAFPSVRQTADDVVDAEVIDPETGEVLEEDDFSLDGLTSQSP